MELYRTIDKRKFQKIHEAIEWNPKSQRILSFVGAGGKTTLLYALSEELAQMGYRVLVMTTTHMRKPEENFYEYHSLPELKAGQVLTVGTTCGDGKIRMPDDVRMDVLCEKADVILVEADGSRRKPFKIPAEHEPVLLPETDLVIGVLGWNSVGQKISEVSHRPADVASFLQKNQEERMTVEDMRKASFDEGGICKNVKVPSCIIWNRWKKEKIEIGKNFPVIFCEEV